MVFLAVLSWLFVCLDLDDTRNLEWEVPAIPILCTQHVKRQRKYEREKNKWSVFPQLPFFMRPIGSFPEPNPFFKQNYLFILLSFPVRRFLYLLNKYLFRRRSNWDSDTFAETFIELGLHCLRCISEVSSEKRLLNISNPRRRKEKRLKNNKLRRLQKLKKKTHYW